MLTWNAKGWRKSNPGSPPNTAFAWPAAFAPFPDVLAAAPAVLAMSCLVK
jgi:hypothetical protein